jgi:hypothetical protein
VAEQTQPAEPDDWVIVFRALKSDTPATIRIRHLLKRALRTFGLKCLSIDRPATTKAAEVERQNPPPT